MRRVTLTLDEKTIDAGKALVQEYGPAASLSAVIRRAVAMLAEEWNHLDSRSLEAATERGAMAKYLAESQRGRQLR